MSGAQVTLEKGARVTAAGQRLDLRFAVDVGAWRYASARFKLHKIDGGPTSGTVVIGIRHAAINETEEYGAISEGGTTDLQFTVNFDDGEGTLTFASSERFSRYLIWEVVSFGLNGTDPAIVFSIELVLKD